MFASLVTTFIPVVGDVLPVFNLISSVVIAVSSSIWKLIFPIIASSVTSTIGSFTVSSL